VRSNCVRLEGDARRGDRGRDEFAVRGEDRDAGVEREVGQSDAERERGVGLDVCARVDVRGVGARDR